MIRASGVVRGQRVVFLGLERENLRRMAHNEPIKVNLARLHPDGGEPASGMPDIDIVIFDIEHTPREDLKALFQVDSEATD